jgi:hypothetical protein
MHRLTRILALLLVFIGMTSYTPFLQAYARSTAQWAMDHFDERPSRAVLLVGNSRTYHNDMPWMIRAMADSASSPERYEITLRAERAGNLAQSWEDPEVRELLQRPWDNIIFQAASAAHFEDKTRDAFFEAGRNLIRAAKGRSGDTAVIVNWAYGSRLGDRELTDDQRREHVDLLQSDHWSLARRTGADLINVGHVWEKVLDTKPDFSLYTDGNHPSVQGTYLAALMVYLYLSGGEVSDVSYLPSGMSEDDAALIRSVIRSYCRSSAAC